MNGWINGVSDHFSLHTDEAGEINQMTRQAVVLTTGPQPFCS